MSDFLMNLARRAAGDEAHGVEIGPSPSAGLAERMALPSVAAPEAPPPAITAASPAAAASVMREAASAPPARPAVAAPPPASVPSPVVPAAAPEPQAAMPSIPTEVRPVSPTSVGPREIENIDLPAPAPDTARLIDSAAEDTPARVAPLSTRSADTPPVFVQVAPPLTGLEVSSTYQAPPSRMREPKRSTVETFREGPPSQVQPRATSIVEATPVEREPIEPAPVVPRIEHPAQVLAPVGHPEPVVSAATPDTTVGSRDRVVPAARRTVEVRIGAIAVHLASPTPAPAADRPTLAGFEDYAAVRNPVYFDRE